MFNRTRLKLTAWYLLIIMAVSIFFSLVIYTAINGEYNRIEYIQRVRQEFIREQLQQDQPAPPAVEMQIIPEARVRLQAFLLLINLGILGISGFAGYFLARRTLRPIKEMVDEQNQFIADASHELRTPLTALRTTIEVNLRDKKLNLKKAKGVLKNNLEEVVGMQNLSEDLLILAKSEQQNKDLNRQKISLNTVVFEAIDKVAVLAGQKKIKITQDISEFIFEGDEDKLVRVLVILLDNAIKYSKEGKTVNVLAKPIDHKVKIMVKDQGLGIPAADLPFIFNRFYRIDKSRSQIEGYGLGLSIAKNIIELHRGAIGVESKEGKGTTFTVVLP